MSLSGEFVRKIIRSKDLFQEIHDWIVSVRPEVQNDPVKRIHSLEDRPDSVYLWELDCTDEQLNNLSQRVKTEFVRKNNRDPQALHLIRNDVTGVEELPPEVVEDKVKPFLEQD